MDRRRFLLMSVAGAIAAPLVADAQPGTKVATVGVLAPSTGRHPIDAAFEQALRDIGWTMNQNLRIAARFSAGPPAALAPLAAELIDLGVHILVAWSGLAAMAATRATSQIPVVLLAAADPVRF